MVLCRGMKIDRNGKWLDEVEGSRALSRTHVKKRPVPVGMEIRRPKRRPRPQQKQYADTPENRLASQVKALLAKAKLPHAVLQKMPISATSRWGNVATLCALGLIVVFGAVSLVAISGKSSSTNNQTVLSDTTATPEFKMIFPEGVQTNIDNNYVSFNSDKNIASYTDKIGAITVTVSQQPLPARFNNNLETELDREAKKAGAIEIIVPSNPITYVGTAANGVQTAVFYKHDLLIYVRAANKVDNLDWTDYVRSLR